MTLPTPSDDWNGTSVARRWLLVLGIWGAVALFSSAQIYVARAALGEPPPLGPLLLLEIPVWAFWALFTVPIVMLARRFPLGQNQARGSVATHAAAAILVAVIAVGFYTLWYQAFNPYPILSTSSVSAWFWHFFRQQFIVGFMIYWATVGVYHAFTNYFLSRVRELEASQAKARLSEARLQALKMQIHPHFLFNTLNSISALIDEQPVEARRVLAQLGDLLRATLRSEASHVVSLKDEVALVRDYLGIEQIRFDDRLAVTTEIDPAAYRAAVPSFLLQPLVENAIRHGIGRRERGGRLWLSAKRINGRLVIHVQDDGDGFDGESGPGEGIGLSNIRNRLRELYGPEQSLVLRAREGGGVDARVELPFRIVDKGP